MAKNKKKPAKENADVTKSDEVLTVVDKKTLKKQRAEQSAKEQKQAQKQTKKKKVDNKPKRNRAKETMSELKKVSWPTFKQALKQTGTVLVVVAIFMCVVLGIDLLLNWIIDLIVKI